MGPEWDASEKYRTRKLLKATYEAAGTANVVGVGPKPQFFIQWRICCSSLLWLKALQDFGLLSA